MESAHQIHANERNGNLHIDLEGQFTPETAVLLTSAIARAYRGRGNIFIHTTKITSISPESKSVFADNIRMLGLPQENLYLTGSKGLDIASDRAKIISHERKKKSCCGRCKDCACNKN